MKLTFEEKKLLYVGRLVRPDVLLCPCRDGVLHQYAALDAGHRGGRELGTDHL